MIVPRFWPHDKRRDSGIGSPLLQESSPLTGAAMVTPSADAGVLGEPSYVWRSGQERRLDLIRRHVPLEGRRILDVGCGVGTYVRRLAGLSPSVFGVDYSFTRVKQGAASVSNLAAAAGEHLPFKDGSFDVVLLNEVIEHVQDDRQTLEESLRVLRQGGHLAIYAPNRLYPFETHGIYLGRRYVFGNIPLINYLPDLLRNRLVPHARAYRAGDLTCLLTGLQADVVVRGYVYPGFDNIAGRSNRGARLLRAALYRAERTSLRQFGLSHFIIVRKR
jgi:SAM-dependent methyltransferase